MENLRFESRNSGQNKAENATFSKNLNSGGHMSDTLIVNLASADWPEKRVMTAAHPVPLSNVSAPGYLLVSRGLLESNNKLLCPYLIDSDAAVF